MSPTPGDFLNARNLGISKPKLEINIAWTDSDESTSQNCIADIQLFTQPRPTSGIQSARVRDGDLSTREYLALPVK